MRAADDRGESMVELLVAMLLMGTAVVAIVGGLSNAIMMSDIHRKQATIATLLDRYAASIENAVATTGYQDCAGSPGHGTYPSFAVAQPGYTADPFLVSYWNGTTTFVGPSCTTDTGVQRVTLRVHSNDGRVSLSRDIVIRRP